MEINSCPENSSQVMLGPHRGSESSDESSGNHLVVTGLYDVDSQERKSSISFDKIKQISLTYSLQSEDDESQPTTEGLISEPIQPNSSRSNSITQTHHQSKQQQQQHEREIRAVGDDSIQQTGCSCQDYSVIDQKKARPLQNSRAVGRPSNSQNTDPKPSKQLHDECYTSEFDVDEHEDGIMPDYDEEYELSTGKFSSHQAYGRVVSRKSNSNRVAHTDTGFSNRGFLTGANSSKRGQTHFDQELASTSRGAYGQFTRDSAVEEYHGRDEDHRDIHQSFATSRVDNPKLRNVVSKHVRQYEIEPDRNPWPVEPFNSTRDDIVGYRIQTRELVPLIVSTSSHSKDQRMVKPNSVLYPDGGFDNATRLHSTSLHHHLGQDSLLQEELDNLIVYASEPKSSCTPDRHLASRLVARDVPRKVLNETRRPEQSLARGPAPISLMSVRAQGARGSIRPRVDVVAGSGRSYNMAESSQPSATARSDVTHLFEG